MQNVVVGSGPGHDLRRLGNLKRIKPLICNARVVRIYCRRLNTTCKKPKLRANENTRESCCALPVLKSQLPVLFEYI
jgi:hypothetical protein